MVWNNNPQNLDDNISNYNHELSKYKSEFAKVSAEFKKDDNITVNSFMAVRPGIEELKRTRKRFASGSGLPVVKKRPNGYNWGQSDRYFITIPINFNARGGYIDISFSRERVSSEYTRLHFCFEQNKLYLEYISAGSSVRKYFYIKNNGDITTNDGYQNHDIATFNITTLPAICQFNTNFNNSKELCILVADYNDYYGSRNYSYSITNWFFYE